MNQQSIIKIKSCLTSHNEAENKIGVDLLKDAIEFIGAKDLSLNNLDSLVRNNVTKVISSVLEKKYKHPTILENLLDCIPFFFDCQRLYLFDYIFDLLNGLYKCLFSLEYDPKNVSASYRKALKYFHALIDRVRTKKDFAQNELYSQLPTEILSVLMVMLLDIEDDECLFYLINIFNETLQSFCDCDDNVNLILQSDFIYYINGACSLMERVKNTEIISISLQLKLLHTVTVFITTVKSQHLINDESRIAFHVWFGTVHSYLEKLLLGFFNEDCNYQEALLSFLSHIFDNFECYTDELIMMSQTIIQTEIFSWIARAVSENFAFKTNQIDGFLCKLLCFLSKPYLDVNENTCVVLNSEASPSDSGYSHSSDIEFASLLKIGLEILILKLKKPLHNYETELLPSCDPILSLATLTYNYFLIKFSLERKKTMFSVRYLMNLLISGNSEYAYLTYDNTLVFKMHLFVLAASLAFNNELEFEHNHETFFNKLQSKISEHIGYYITYHFATLKFLFMVPFFTTEFRKVVLGGLISQHVYYHGGKYQSKGTAVDASQINFYKFLLHSDECLNIWLSSISTIYFDSKYGRFIMRTFFEVYFCKLQSQSRMNELFWRFLKDEFLDFAEQSLTENDENILLNKFIEIKKMFQCVLWNRLSENSKLFLQLRSDLLKKLFAEEQNLCKNYIYLYLYHQLLLITDSYTDYAFHLIIERNGYILQRLVETTFEIDNLPQNNQVQMCVRESLRLKSLIILNTIMCCNWFFYHQNPNMNTQIVIKLPLLLSFCDNNEIFKNILSEVLFFVRKLIESYYNVPLAPKNSCILLDKTKPIKVQYFLRAVNMRCQNILFAEACEYSKEIVIESWKTLESVLKCMKDNDFIFHGLKNCCIWTHPQFNDLIQIVIEDSLVCDEFVDLVETWFKLNVDEYAKRIMSTVFEIEKNMNKFYKLVDCKLKMESLEKLDRMVYKFSQLGIGISE